MYYKCYVNNNINDPFIPENIGVYTVNIYYNKYTNRNDGIYANINPCVEQFKNKNIGKYVVVYNKPSSQEYQQISEIGNYQVQ